MRILQLVLAPRLSGAEVLVKGIAIGHQRAGHSVCIASLLPPLSEFANMDRELQAAGVTRLFPERRYNKLGRLVFLYQAIRQFKPDIIFAHATIPALYVRALPTRVPIAWVMHSGINDFRNSRLQHAERLLSSRAKAVIGVSQQNVDDYLREIGHHPSMIVVPNGVDTTRFGAGAAGEGVRNGFAKTKQIVQIGRYVPEKGHFDTVRAFKRVLDAEPDANLVMCGTIEDHAYQAEVKSFASALGLDEHVEIGGPRANVAEVLRSSRVFAMPSRFEGHSIGFLEALASGIPVVANAIHGFAFARNFPGVRLVDTSDTEAYARALIESLKEPLAARPLEGLTLEDTADRYLAIARQVLGLRLRTA